MLDLQIPFLCCRIHGSDNGTVFADCACGCVCVRGPKETYSIKLWFSPR